MGYIVKALENGKFAIAHEYKTFNGFIYETEEEAMKTISGLRR